MVSCRQPTVYEEADASETHHGDALGSHDASLDGVMRDASMITDAVPTCAPANILHGDGHHNPGQDCLGSCHNHGFSIAGTLNLADNVTPANNATVTIADANGGKQEIIVSTNGNFFVSSGRVSDPSRVEPLSKHEVHGLDGGDGRLQLRRVPRGSSGHRAPVASATIDRIADVMERKPALRMLRTAGLDVANSGSFTNC